MRHPRLDDEQQQTLDLLQDLVALARRGELDALFLAAQDPDGTGYFVATADDETPTVELIMHLVEMLPAVDVATLACKLAAMIPGHAGAN